MNAKLVLLAAALAISVVATGLRTQPTRRPLDYTARRCSARSGIGVKDLESSTRFYTDVLGMKVLRRFELGYLNEVVMGSRGRRQRERGADELAGRRDAAL